MKLLLFILLFFCVTGILYAGLSFPIDQEVVGIVCSPSFSNFLVGQDIGSLTICQAIEFGGAVNTGNFDIEPSKLIDFYSSDFVGDVTPDEPSLGDIPSNAVPWSEFDFESVEYVNLYIPGLDIISYVPCDLVPIFVQMGFDPWVIPVEPSNDIPEPVSLLLVGVGCLMLCRRC